jgi:AcrR family transcriptional regulator
MSARATPKRRPRVDGASPTADGPPPVEAVADEATPVAGLAASQLRRLRRIVDSAVLLAEKGGFEGVRLRDVAEASDVALGTLYKYFRNKEDILLFALTEQVDQLELAMVKLPTEGASPLERCENFFRRSTRGLTQRPQFARAVLRSMASGDPEIAVKIASFHMRMTRLIVSAMRGETPDVTSPVLAEVGTERERQVAFMLMHVWYSSLAGWAGGLHSTRIVVEHVRTAASLMNVPATPSSAVDRPAAARAEAR